MPQLKVQPPAFSQNHYVQPCCFTYYCNPVILWYHGAQWLVWWRCFRKCKHQVSWNCKSPVLKHLKIKSCFHSQKQFYKDCNNLTEPVQVAVFNASIFFHRFICQYKHNKNSPSFLGEQCLQLVIYSALKSGPVLVLDPSGLELGTELVFHIQWFLWTTDQTAQDQSDLVLPWS